MADKFTNFAALTEFLAKVKEWANGAFASISHTHTKSQITDFPTIPTKVSQLTNDSGYTSNTGTITGITMNGASKGTSGVVNLGTVITAHQDISGKANTADLATVATSGSYNDLSNKPSIPAAVAVKGDSETNYRTGNVNITKANIGLGNVGNFKAVSTVASQGLTDTEKSNARANIGAGTSSFSGSYNDLSNKPTIPAEVTESTVSGWGFTKNAGTVTGIKMNGSSKGTSGVVDLGTVITAHQDISGKQDKITAITAQTTQAVYPIKIDSQGHITAYGSAVTIPAAVAVKGDSESTYRTGNVNITKANIGLGNVGNFKAVSTVASQGLTDTEKSNARTNIGAGTSSFSGSYNDLSNKPTIPTAVAVKGNSETSYRTGNVNLTAANIGAAASSHTHGNIQNGGTLQSSDITIASGDKLVVTDSSDSNKVARASISFDGSTTTQFLSKKGTWQTVAAGNVSHNDDASAGSAASINADLLQNRAASYFATAADVEVLQEEVDELMSSGGSITEETEFNISGLVFTIMKV